MIDLKINSIVQAVLPNKIILIIKDIKEFKKPGDLRIGSFIEVESENGDKIVGIIENFRLTLAKDELEDWLNDVENTTEDRQEPKQKKDSYTIEATPLGIISLDDQSREYVFVRGGHQITIPPKTVIKATDTTIKILYKQSGSDKINDKFFRFSHLANDLNIAVPVDGNKFFNKHIGIVGSTGSGKSHTVSTLIQKAISEKNSPFNELNNSHIVIFDMHGEYKSAFPDSGLLTVDDIKIPYWLLSPFELHDLLIDAQEERAYKQIAILKDAVTKSKQDNNSDPNKTVTYNTTTKFKIAEVIDFIKIENEKMVDGANNRQKQGDNFGVFTNFLTRLNSKIQDKRFDFLFSDSCEDIKIKDVLEQFLSYKNDDLANVTIIDLSGVPFEVLSIVISVVSRIIFEYGYYYKKYIEKISNEDNKKDMDTPILIVYEEIHKYAPKSEFSKYQSARESIERIVKEGRKYGVSAMIVSQRPSEVSDTIFSQCNNFVAMRLTNPLDQEYIKKLLPDNLGSLVDNLPSLQCGEALLVGEAVTIPSLVKIDKPTPEPHSSDIPYLDHWRNPWKEILFDDLIDTWN
jgi:uncharacterized protein